MIAFHPFFAVSAVGSINKSSTIKIFDNLGFEIEMKFLGSVIKKYEKGEHFYLRIQLVDNDEEILDEHAATIADVCMVFMGYIICQHAIIQLQHAFSQELERFLIKQRLKHLLPKSKCDRKSMELVDRDRHRIIRETSNLMLSKFGPHPSTAQYDVFASALKHLYLKWDKVNCNFLL